MPEPADFTSGSAANGADRADGRYRFQRDRALDPDEGVHPEMASHQPAASVSRAIPDSPEQLIAMQRSQRPEQAERPEKPDHQPSAKLQQLLDLIDQLDTSAAEDQQLALRLVRRLEQFHDDVVSDLREDEEASHSQIVSWAIDADRLYRCRMLLESVALS